MSKYTLLIDGDIVAYRAGFAAEKKVYYDMRTPPKDGGSSFSYKKEALAVIPQDYLTYERELEPLDNALYNCKSLIQTAIDKVSEEFDTEDIMYVTFMTGNTEVDNFRNKVSSEYKANRDKLHRPTYLDEIKDYLVRKHSGYLSQGCEADDFFGQASSDAKGLGRVPIIASIDKDLKQIAGYHYNFMSGQIEEISEELASVVFWRQMLEGDRVDNIQGIKGIGEVKARNTLPVGTTNEEAKELVLKYYQKDFEEWEKKYNENADLLWIWRKVPDSCPHKIED